MILSFIAMVSYSQNSATFDKYLDFDDTGFLFTGASTDVLTTTDSTWTYTILKKFRSDIKCVVKMLVDSTGGTANNVDIVLKNKHFANDTYATVSTVTWDGANDASDGERISFTPSLESYTFNADSTTTITATDQYYMGEYWQVSLTGADNTLLAAIRWLNFKFIE